MNLPFAVQQQTDAYNLKDIDLMLSVFAESIEIVKLKTGEKLLNGKNECLVFFENLFANSPDLKAEILETIVFDNTVIVREMVYGRNGITKPIEQLLLYELVDNKISKLSVASKEI
ncbi:MAG: hypothetical protein RI955_364 [Bacteroidota bacterium]